MRFYSFFCVIVMALFWALPTFSQDTTATEEEPFISQLFQSDDIIKVTIKTELRTLLRDRRDERDYHDATMTYADGGEMTTIPLRLRVRGNFRRKKSTCFFPPIRLKFDSAEVVGTLFEGQNKIKLVTHCQNKKSVYQQYLLEEYTIYRMYNQLTDKSFRVRLMDVTYIDTGKKPDTLQKYGFIIEDVGHLATRLGGREIEVKNIHPDRTNYDLVNTLSVFQYMIANTDFSIPALHNVKLVMVNPGEPPLAIPYDFDWCGLIKAPYAIPNESLGLGDVRQRLFRGFCRSEEQFEETFQLFRDKKEAIYSLFRDSEYMDEKTKTSAISYLEKFYDIINNPKEVEREFMKKCRTTK